VNQIQPQKHIIRACPVSQRTWPRRSACHGRDSTGNGSRIPSNRLHSSCSAQQSADAVHLWSGRDVRDGEKGSTCALDLPSYFAEILLSITFSALRMTWRLFANESKPFALAAFSTSNLLQYILISGAVPSISKGQTMLRPLWQERPGEIRAFPFMINFEPPGNNESSFADRMLS
jgi:hypothetical protein